MFKYSRDTARYCTTLRAPHRLDLLSNIWPIEIRVIHTLSRREAAQQFTLPHAPCIDVDIVVTHVTDAIIAPHPPQRASPPLPQFPYCVARQGGTAMPTNRPSPHTTGIFLPARP